MICVDCAHKSDKTYCHTGLKMTAKTCRYYISTAKVTCNRADICKRKGCPYKYRNTSYCVWVNLRPQCITIN